VALGICRVDNRPTLVTQPLHSARQDWQVAHSLGSAEHLVLPGLRVPLQGVCGHSLSHFTDGKRGVQTAATPGCRETRPSPVQPSEKEIVAGASVPGTPADKARRSLRTSPVIGETQSKPP
jgi:hypothetical protein